MRSVNALYRRLASDKLPAAWAAVDFSRETPLRASSAPRHPAAQRRYSFALRAERRLLADQLAAVYRAADRRAAAADLDTYRDLHRLRLLRRKLQASVKCPILFRESEKRSRRLPTPARDQVSTKP